MPSPDGSLAGTRGCTQTWLGLEAPFQNVSGTAELLLGLSSLGAGSTGPVVLPALPRGQCHATPCQGGMGNATIPTGHRVFWGTQCPVPKDDGINHHGKCGEQLFEEK